MEKKTRAGTKQNLREIIEAIKVLKRHEINGIEIGEEEREALARFTGFGGVANIAFPDPVTDEFKPEAAYLGAELRELLTNDEYESAKATTFSAFYTSEIVMQAMYRGLDRIGIQGGARGLEPGCGIGNFVSAAPSAFDFIGVEQDSISGRIARLLNPDHEIRIEGFQDTDLPEESVDFAVGNVPFANIKLRYRDGERHALHDYFFLRSLDAVRPGGAMALVTSRYTLDKVDASVRQKLAEKADFIGAIRLPGDAFVDQGTKVVTDIIFLRKKGRGQEASPPWSGNLWLTSSSTSLEGGDIPINDYFQAFPEMVLGEMSVGHGMHNAKSLRVRSDGELAAALHAAMDGLPSDICSQRSNRTSQAASKPLEPSAVSHRETKKHFAGDSQETPLPPHALEGSFFVASDKRLMQVVRGTPEPVVQRGKELKSDGTPGARKLAALVDLRDRAREVLRTQRDSEPMSAREEARASLRSAYKAFGTKYGPINKTTISERQDGGLTRRMPNIVRFRSDPDVFLVMALEHYDERTGEATQAAIMEQDVVSPPAPIMEVTSAKDGLVASLSNRGQVDLAYISSLYGKPESAIVDELEGLIFFDPLEQAYVTADEYLSGNVRKKLDLAEISDDPRTKGNIAALKQAQPEDLGADEIDVSLGAPWIPTEDIARFISETLEIAPSSVAVKHLAKEALWKVRPEYGYRSLASAKSEWGTGDVDAFALVEQALNLRIPTVKRPVPGTDEWEVDQEATMAARSKQEQLKHRFSDWIFEDPGRTNRLVAYYNEHFNNIRAREYDGAHLTFPGMSKAIAMRPHQKDAVWRAVSSGNTLFAHVVGAGKTFTMIASGMEAKRMGLAKKPAFVVPNHMLEQFSRELLLLYPDANVLVASKEDLRKNRRQLLKAKMVTGQWDGIVITHSSFEKIAMSPQFRDTFIRREIEAYEELLKGTDDRSLEGKIHQRIKRLENDRKISRKELEKRKAAKKERLKEDVESDRKDDGLYFDELGIDLIFFDEAHLYKNLETHTKMTRVAGVQTGGSQRAFDLLMKTRYLHQQSPGRGIVFATGTPVSNSLGEIYTMMRYLMPEELEARGLGHFDAWAAAFGEVVSALEISPDGKSLRVNSRFAKFKNLPELLTLFRTTADVKTAAMLKLPVPAIEGGKPEVVASPMSVFGKEYQDHLVGRYERIRSGGIHPSIDNALNVVTDGRKLALDPRLVSPEAEDHPDSKINQIVKRVYDIWRRTEKERSTQLIFADLGVNPTEWGFSVYTDLIEKLSASGIPREEIATIGDANTDAKKEVLFGQVRSGQVRILLGSTTKMGTGTNVQERLAALHHVDPPWRPADIEQREGRILRQGNRNKQIEIIRYVTEGSFDAYMWQTLETKAKFIAQAMAGDAGTRRADDIGGAELSFAEVKAIASGNPAMLVLAEIDLELRQLKLLRKAHFRDQAKISAEIARLPDVIVDHEKRLDELQKDVERRVDTKGDLFLMKVAGRIFNPEKGEQKTARQRADSALKLIVAKTIKEARLHRHISEEIGEIGGLKVVIDGTKEKTDGSGDYAILLEGEGRYRIQTFHHQGHCTDLSKHLERELRDFDRQIAVQRAEYERLSVDLERYQAREGLPFEHEHNYQALRPMQNRLGKLLQQLETSEDELKEAKIESEISAIVDLYRAMDLAASPEPGQEVGPAPIVPDARSLSDAEASALLAGDQVIPEADLVVPDEPKDSIEDWEIQPLPVASQGISDPQTDVVKVTDAAGMATVLPDGIVPEVAEGQQAKPVAEVNVRTGEREAETRDANVEPKGTRIQDVQGFRSPAEMTRAIEAAPVGARALIRKHDHAHLAIKEEDGYWRSFSFIDDREHGVGSGPIAAFYIAEAMIPWDAIRDHLSFLTAEERERLIWPVDPSAKKHDVTPPPGTIAIVREPIFNHGELRLAIKDEHPDSWHIVEHRHALQAGELAPWAKTRAGWGWKDSLWVDEHLVPREEITEEVLLHLHEHEKASLIPAQAQMVVAGDRAAEGFENQGQRPTRQAKETQSQRQDAEQIEPSTTPAPGSTAEQLTSTAPEASETGHLEESNAVVPAQAETQGNPESISGSVAIVRNNLHTKIATQVDENRWEVAFFYPPYFDRKPIAASSTAWVTEHLETVHSIPTELYEHLTGDERNRLIDEQQLPTMPAAEGRSSDGSEPMQTSLFSPMAEPEPQEPSQVAGSPIENASEQLGLFGPSNAKPSTRVRQAGALAAKSKRKAPDDRPNFGRFTAMIGQQMTIEPSTTRPPR